MKTIHKLLRRQMKKHLGVTEIPRELEKFLYAVNEAYNEFDEDRLMIERSLEISSEELSEAIEKLKETQMKLVQQEKMASIGQLSAGIGHEINNPLGFVISNLSTLDSYIDKYCELISIYESMTKQLPAESLIKMEKLMEELKTFEKENEIDFIKEDIKELVSDSNEGLARIARIVKNLRDFSRSDQFMEFMEYDLNEGIQSTLLIANNIIKYNAEVKVEASDVPLIKAAGAEINQVILNLLINAAYAIKQKKKFGEIKICTEYDENFVYLEIQDDGVGIDENQLSQIFNPFFTTKPVGEGTGLGLSIAYDIIVNKHKGSITASSIVGIGTTFFIKLPIQR